MRKTLLLIMLTLIMPQQSYAASDDECGIWLCLPFGFPSGCGGSKSAFKHRIKHGHSPLPNISECGGDDNDITYRDNVAAVIGEQKKCTHWHQVGGKNGRKVCDKWDVVPERVIDGEACIHRVIDHEQVRIPEGCIKTLHYVETYDHNVKMGERYYYDPNE